MADDKLERDAKFISLWADKNFDPGAKASCALEAGYKAATIAKRSTGKIITSLMQNKRMQKEMKKAGVTMERLAKKIDELLDAKHPLSPTNKPDNFVQLKAAELGIRLHDAFAPTRLELDKRETKQIVLTAEVIHRLERFNSQRDLIRTGETFDVRPEPPQQS